MIRRKETLAWLALALLLLIAGLVLYHETRGTNLWFDEWDWALQRRGGGLATFLRPHNEHLSLIPVAIYKLLFATAGIGDYRPYRVIVIVAHLAVATLLFVYARRRVGDLLGLLAAALILFFGPGWQNFIWPFQVAWLISLAAGIAALMMLDRADRAGDVAACVLLLISIASSGIGVAIGIGLAVDVLWRRSWRDAWILAVPALLYAIWWIGYQHTSFQRHALVLAPDFVASAAASALAAVVGLSGPLMPAQSGYSGTLLEWGPPLVAGGLALAAWRIVRMRAIPIRVATLGAMTLSFWVLTAVNRSTITDPFASRYLYVGALFILLLACELARGVAVRSRAQLVVGLVALAAVVANFGALRDGVRFLRMQGQETAADLGAFEIGRGSVSNAFPASSLPGYPLVVVNAGSYFSLARAAGTPALAPAQLQGAGEDARMVADAQLVAIHSISLVPGAAAIGAAPRVDSIEAGSVQARGGCIAFTAAAFTRAAAAQGAIAVTIPPAGVQISVQGGAASVALRRFAVGFHQLGTLAPGTTAALRIPADRAVNPWHLNVTPATRATICGRR